MSVEPVVPLTGPQGEAISPAYDDVYASRDGALGQARHVFLGGNGLPARWAGRPRFTVLETGFGLGVNFLATWQAWRDDPARPRRLCFVSVERHPVPAEALTRFAPPELAPRAASLAAAWPLPLPGLHRLSFDDHAVTLLVGFGDAAALVPQLVLAADAFYLDGFAPGCNPAMWAPELLRALARHAADDATLATWCVARPVRDALAAAGFAVETRPGFGRKREMTAGRFAPRWTVRRHQPPRPWEAGPAATAGAPRHAIVVGAGLAGCATAMALARRGWRVDVLDAGEGPAQGASRLPGGLLHPEVTRDDSVLARLTRAGYLVARQELAALQAAAPAVPLWAPGGVLQVDPEAAVDPGRAAALAALPLPPDYAQWVSAATASARAGAPVRQGGWWFPGGGIVSGARWCAAMLAASSGVRFTGGCRVDTLAPAAREDGGGWQVAGDGFARRASLVVLANAVDAARLLGRPAWWPMRPVRGRISRVPASALPALKAGVAGDGYAVPAWDGDRPATPDEDGIAGAGATYETPDPGAPWPDWAFVPLSRLTDPVGHPGPDPAGRDDPSSTARPGPEPAAWDDAAAHRANSARMARLFGDPAWADAGQARAGPSGGTWTPGIFDGVRCVADDRLPFAGAVPDASAVRVAGAALRGAHLQDLPRLDGLFTACALGSRGVVLAALMGDLLAAQVEGEPWPLPRDLAGAVDPGRYLLRAVRRGRA